MAIPRVYKAITSHQKQCEFAEEFMISYRQDLADSLTELFQQDSAEGENVPDVLAFADALLRRLRGALQSLLEAENLHLDELADDAQHRTQRDKAAAGLRQTLIGLREIFRKSFGFEQAEAIGFEREIVADPAAMLRQTRRLMANLGRPDLALPAAQFAGITLTPESIVAQMKPQADALRDALRNVTQQLSAVQGTQVDKDLAVETFTDTYVLFLRILQGCFRLAGKEELAKRLRRAIPRSGSTRTVDEPATDSEPSAGDGEDEASEPTTDTEPAEGGDLNIP